MTIPELCKLFDCKDRAIYQILYAKGWKFKTKPFKIDKKILAEKCGEMTSKELAAYFNCYVTLVNRALRSIGMKSKKPKYVMSPENKKKMREGLAKWEKENPDKLSWRNQKSQPCENVKAFLRSRGIPYIEEYPAISERKYSIDIAFPDKMIGLEINGTQHYNKDGTLAEYFQERHDLLVKNGWTIHEIFYKGCFKFDDWDEFINQILNSIVVVEFDYLSWSPPRRQREKINGKVVTNWIQKKECLLCDNLINMDYTFCRKHARQGHITFKKLPSPEVIQDLLNEFPLWFICQKFNVSRLSLHNFCRCFDLNIPNQMVGPYLGKKRDLWEKLMRMDIPINEKEDEPLGSSS